MITNNNILRETPHGARRIFVVEGGGALVAVPRRVFLLVICSNEKSPVKGERFAANERVSEPCVDSDVYLDWLAQFAFKRNFQSQLSACAENPAAQAHVQIAGSGPMGDELY